MLHRINKLKAWKYTSISSSLVSILKSDIDGGVHVEMWNDIAEHPQISVDNESQDALLMLTKCREGNTRLAPVEYWSI